MLTIKQACQPRPGNFDPLRRDTVLDLVDDRIDATEFFEENYNTGKANETRLKTASELGRSDLGSSTFGTSLVRHALYATWRAAETEDAVESLTWLRDELPNYWNSRDALTTVLRYFAAADIDHWREDAAAARLIAGAVENDHV